MGQFEITLLTRPYMSATPMKRLFIATFSVAFVAFILPWMAWISRFGLAVDLMARVSLALTVAWFLLLGLTLVRLRRRGLWALLVLPLVVFWPSVFSLMAYACAQNANNCP
jgi:hypothetical protein